MRELEDVRELEDNPLNDEALDGASVVLVPSVLLPNEDPPRVVVPSVLELSEPGRIDDVPVRPVALEPIRGDVSEPTRADGRSEDEVVTEDPTPPSLVLDRVRVPDNDPVLGMHPPVDSVWLVVAAGWV